MLRSPRPSEREKKKRCRAQAKLKGRKRLEGLADLEKCDPAARAPYIGMIVELLRDTEDPVREKSVVLLKKCGAEGRKPHMSRVIELLQARI